MKLVKIVILTTLLLAISAYIYLTWFKHPLESNKLPRIDGAKILIIISDGFDYSEYSITRDLIIKQGGKAITASFKTGKIESNSGQIANADITFDNVNISEYVAIFIPGGRSPANIVNHPNSSCVLKLIREANERGIIIAAVCHGPLLLAKANIVNGKKVTGHPDTFQELKDAGGIVTTNILEVDNNIITAPYEGRGKLANTLILLISNKIGEG